MKLCMHTHWFHSVYTRVNVNSLCHISLRFSVTIRQLYCSDFRVYLYLICEPQPQKQRNYEEGLVWSVMLFTLFPIFEVPQACMHDASSTFSNPYSHPSIWNWIQRWQKQNDGANKYRAHIYYTILQCWKQSKLIFVSYPSIWHLPVYALRSDRFWFC